MHQQVVIEDDEHVRRCYVCDKPSFDGAVPPICVRCVLLIRRGAYGPVFGYDPSKVRGST